MLGSYQCTMLSSQVPKVWVSHPANAPVASVSSARAENTDFAIWRSSECGDGSDELVEPRTRITMFGQPQEDASAGAPGHCALYLYAA